MKGVRVTIGPIRAMGVPCTGWLWRIVHSCATAAFFFSRFMMCDMRGSFGRSISPLLFYWLLTFSYILQRCHSSQQDTFPPFHLSTALPCISIPKSQQATRPPTRTQ
jgi:hypothetical protein